ncbi:50S ribosomal protein L17 [bacterium HR30]|nr:50S ribosomal protein L17 [bacterium HR30]
MRHLKAGRKLSRTSAHRKALMRNLATALVEREQIKTTDAKAKELRRVVDHLITLGKRGTLHARRQAAAILRSKGAVKKLFDELAPRFAQRNGGYTRILKFGRRLGDAAPISVVEFTERGADERSASSKARKAEPSARA